MWYWWVFRLWKLYVQKNLIDKLVDECTETLEELKRAIINLAENENSFKCSSCTVYIML